MMTSQEFTIDMSKSEKRELESRLYVIIEHVIKSKYIKGPLAADNLRGWNKSVRDQCLELVDLLAAHPGMKPDVNDNLIDDLYRVVAADLQKEYPSVQFPRLRQLSMDEIVGKSVMALLMKR